MRITLQITCDNEAEAQTIIKKITAPPTWIDELEKTNPAPAKHAYSNGVALTESRIDKIMGSSGDNAAEQPSSGSRAADAPRPNNSLDIFQRLNFFVSSAIQPVEALSSTNLFDVWKILKSN